MLGLVDGLSLVDILRKLATKLLSSRLLTILLLLVVHLLISHLIITWTNSLFYDHASCIATSITILPQSCRIHLTSRSTRINRVFFYYLVNAVVVAALDHGTVLRGHVLCTSELLETTEI